MSWTARLQRPSGSTVKVDVNARALLTSFPKGPPCACLKDALLETYEAWSGELGSRHDNTRDRVLDIIRLGEKGHPGAQRTLRVIRSHYVPAVASNRVRGEAEAAGEFTRMVAGGLAIVAAEPTPDDEKGCDVDNPVSIPVSGDDTGSDQQVGEPGTDPALHREVLKQKRLMLARRIAESELDVESVQDEEIGDIVLFRRDGNAPPPSRIHPRSDGAGLLYSGELHWLYGRPAAGKSWVSSWVIATALTAGSHVVLLDYENTTKRITDRLVDLGVDEEQIEAGLHLPTIRVINSTPRALAFRQYLGRIKPALVVIDAANPCLTAHGWDENRSGDINRAIEVLVNPAREIGATVIVLDHVTKDPKGASYPINSQAKLAQVTGVAYRMETAEDFKPGVLNEALLVVTKDRHGDVLAVCEAGQAALFKLDSRGDDMRAWADPVMLPAGEEVDLGRLAERFAERLRSHHEQEQAPLSRQELLLSGGLISGAKSKRAEIIDHAVSQGLVEVVREGRRRIVKPKPVSLGGLQPPRVNTASDQQVYEPGMSDFKKVIPGSERSGGRVLHTSVEEALKAVEAAGKGVGLDIETSGLDAHSEVRTVQVSVDGSTFVIDAQQAGSPAVKQLLDAASRLVVHNAPYDLMVLANWIGCPPAEWASKTVDTLTLARLADPQMTAGRDLKSLTRAHIDPDYDSDSAALAEVRRLGIKGVRSAGAATTHLPIDNPVFLEYAARDAEVLPVLESKLAASLDSELIAFERELQRIALGMTWRGVRVDRERLEHTVSLLTERLVSLDAKAARYGLTGLTVSTKVDKEKLARTLKRLKVHVRKTPGGAPKFDEEAIQAYASKAPEALQPVLSDVLVYRQAFKLCGYLAGYHELSARDGRVHPRINTLEARTGRMSMAEPNLQNVPRAGGIRECFIPDPGHVVVSADFRQIEPRVVAALSGDEAMIEATQAGDLYAALAEQTGTQRDDVKVCVLAWTYGGEPRGISRQTGLSQEQAVDVTRRLRKAFPQLAGYRDRMRGHSQPITLDSKRTVHPDARGTAAANYAVQGNARDIFAQAMVRVAHAGFEKWMWFPVHDELIFGVPAEDAAGVTIQIEQSMTSEFRGVCIPVECKVLGERWSK